MVLPLVAISCTIENLSVQCYQTLLNDVLVKDKPHWRRKIAERTENMLLLQEGWVQYSTQHDTWAHSQEQPPPLGWPLQNKMECIFSVFLHRSYCLCVLQVILPRCITQVSTHVNESKAVAAQNNPNPLLCVIVQYQQLSSLLLLSRNLSVAVGQGFLFPFPVLNTVN